jgi:hypothetical protein
MTSRNQHRCMILYLVENASDLTLSVGSRIDCMPDSTYSHSLFRDAICAALRPRKPERAARAHARGEADSRSIPTG